VRPDTGAGLAGVGLGTAVAVAAGRAVGLARVGAGAVGGIAGASVVALIEGATDDRVCAGADARLAGIALRAGVAVVAGGAVHLGRVGAGAGGRITDAGLVALVRGSADDGVRAGAGAGLAGVALRAGVAVVAGHTVRGRRVRADAARRVADAGDMTLILGRADDRVRADAGAAEAGAALGAEVAVLAGREIGERRVRAPGRRIAAVGGAGVVVVTVGWRPPDAAPARAGVGRGAGVAVVARRRVVRVRTAGCRVARVGGAE